MKLSEKIITLRNKHRMSQGDLAEKLNVSRQSVSKWETGASVPDLDKLIAMSELFHVTMDELVKDGVEIGCEVAEQKDELSNENDDEMCNNACDIVVKHEKRIFRIVIGVVLSLWSIIFMICFQSGLITMRSVIISFFMFLWGLIFIFCKKNPLRISLIVTAVIAVGYILICWIDYLARL